MSPADAVRHAFTHYATFSGRARRSEYWWFALFTFVGSVVASLVDAAVLGRPVLQLLFVLTVVVPSIAVTVRRLHDTDRSGGWYFIALVPLVGVILLLVWAATEGTRGDNRYGASPKQALAPGYGY